MSHTLQHRTGRLFRILAFAAAAAGMASLAACMQIESTITPLREETVDAYWELVDDPAATAPSTMAATSAAATTQMAAPSTAPETAPAVASTQATRAATSTTTSAATTQATAPSTLASTEPAAQTAATEPAATEPEPAVASAKAPLIFRGETPPPAPPGKKYVKRERPKDPNETERFAYRVNYDYLFNHAQQSLSDMGFTIDRRDFRLGVITTRPRYAAQIVEPWRADQSGAKSAFESTMHSQRRTIRLSIRRAPNPAFYEVGVQVLVDRESNPNELLSGAVTYGGRENMALARSPRTLKTDHVGVTNIPEDAAAATQPAPKPLDPPPHWIVIGRDAALEAKILEAVFKSL